jgi:hypothetical protein
MAGRQTEAIDLGVLVWLYVIFRVCMYLIAGFMFLLALRWRRDDPNSAALAKIGNMTVWPCTFMSLAGGTLAIIYIAQPPSVQSFAISLLGILVWLASLYVLKVTRYNYAVMRYPPRVVYLVLGVSMLLFTLVTQVPYHF